MCLISLLATLRGAWLQSRPYTVRTGDTMRSIAEKRKVPLETLLKMNHDVSPDALTEGQRLQLPVGELSVRDQEILVRDLLIFLHYAELCFCPLRQ